MQQHQCTCIDVLLGKQTDLNRCYISQCESSKIRHWFRRIWAAILQGTQTKYDLCPNKAPILFFAVERSGDLQEAFVVIGLFLWFVRTNYLRGGTTTFAVFRIYGYGVAQFSFSTRWLISMHYYSVIGIPLPFFSYGDLHLVLYHFVFHFISWTLTDCRS